MDGCPALQAQLQTLHMGECTDLAHVLRLQQLQRLTLCPDFAEQRQLLQLEKLPALHELHLGYSALCGRAAAAAAAAPVWVLLPQLRGLSVTSLPKPDKQPASVAAILAGAAAATQLTSLTVNERDGATKGGRACHCTVWEAGGPEGAPAIVAASGVPGAR